MHVGCPTFWLISALIIAASLWLTHFARGDTSMSCILSTPLLTRYWLNNLRCQLTSSAVLNMSVHLLPACSVNGHKLQRHSVLLIRLRPRRIAQDLESGTNSYQLDETLKESILARDLENESEREQDSGRKFTASMDQLSVSNEAIGYFRS